MTIEKRAQLLTELATLPRVFNGLPRGPGDVTPGLIDLCQVWIKPDFDMVEVGCFRGVSTRVFALFAQTVWAVDPWSMATADYRDLLPERVAEAEAQFLVNIRDYPNIFRVQNFSVSAAKGFDDASLDAVYIDGDHREAMFHADVRAWLPKLKPTGLLMGHDYTEVWRYFPDAGLPKPEAHYSEDSWVVSRENIR